MYKILLTSSRNNDENRDIIMEGLETFEKELAHRQGPFFGGAVPGMLDYMIWPWCERADLLKLFGNQFALNKDKYKRLVSQNRQQVELSMSAVNVKKKGNKI